MNIQNLEQQLSLLQNIGYTLNIDEKLKLKLAHIKTMESHTKLDQLKFWGKIQGVAKNYYIMLGLQYKGCYEFPHKYFFWASQDFQFKELPQLLLQHQSFSEKFNVFFSGDPTKILVNLEGEGQGEGNENPDPENSEQKKQKQISEEQQQMKKVPKKNYTQLHRLAHVVRAIENDAQCVPKGSYCMTPEHQLCPVSHFYGLNESNCTKLCHWLHFRSPQLQKTRKKMQSEDVVFNHDFLDNLTEDLPKGVWSIQANSEKRNVCCKNLQWPGYFSFHLLKSDVFGSAYIGSGIKNIDVAFMI